MSPAEFDGLEHPADFLPGWVEFDPPSPQFVAGQAEGDERGVVLRGWPRRTLGHTIYVDFQAGRVRSLMAIDTGSLASSGEMRLLPLRPLWPGFAINTLFYAGILWLLFAAPARLRRRLRIKRGLCPKCAYPVGASEVCTECGELLPPAS